MLPKVNTHTLSCAVYFWVSKTGEREYEKINFSPSKKCTFSRKGKEWCNSLTTDSLGVFTFKTSIKSHSYSLFATPVPQRIDKIIPCMNKKNQPLVGPCLIISSRSSYIESKHICQGNWIFLFVEITWRPILEIYVWASTLWVSFAQQISLNLQIDAMCLPLCTLIRSLDTSQGNTRVEVEGSMKYIAFISTSQWEAQ